MDSINILKQFLIENQKVGYHKHDGYSEHPVRVKNHDEYFSGKSQTKEADRKNFKIKPTKINPLVSSLHEKYPEVKILGTSGMESDRDDIKPINHFRNREINAYVFDKTEYFKNFPFLRTPTDKNIQIDIWYGRGSAARPSTYKFDTIEEAYTFVFPQMSNERQTNPRIAGRFLNR